MEGAHDQPVNDRGETSERRRQHEHAFGPRQAGIAVAVDGLRSLSLVGHSQHRPVAPSLARRAAIPTAL